ncbi:MAG: uL15 family ribosomal protein [Candidatus Woesearchaeota archaeon]|nr:MAG: uL15 family ribosomal protein [Candidatus Woesearchaeota archaeon]
MVVNKRKKNSRQRASHTHGWGAKKKHRGAGSRGGRGMAGTGKRAGQKRSAILQIYGLDYFGRKGFNRPQKVKKEVKAINIKQLELKIENLVAKGLAKKSGDTFEVDLIKLGYSKLLGTGQPKRKFSITAKAVSRHAVEKIENSGGKISITKSEEKTNGNIQNNIKQSARS